MLGPDTYPNFEVLAAKEREGIDYRVIIRQRKSFLGVFAPHGGGIEPGTSELASALAGEQASLYLFEGLVKSDSSRLHITSTHFDEPRCTILLEEVCVAITIHGCQDPMPVAYTGGLDLNLQSRILHSLRSAGFTAYPDRLNRNGSHHHNLCNRGSSGRGLQLELSDALRRKFFSSLDKAGRSRPTPFFHHFLAALQSALPFALREY